MCEYFFILLSDNKESIQFVVVRFLLLLLHFPAFHREKSENGFLEFTNCSPIMHHLNLTKHVEISSMECEKIIIFENRSAMVSLIQLSMMKSKRD